MAASLYIEKQILFIQQYFVSQLSKQEFAQTTEAATRGILWKKVFLEISQN